MKKTIFVLILWSLLIGVIGQTNDDYSLLKIYRGSTGSNTDSVKVKVYNQQAFNVAPNTVVTFKIYSTGGFVISASNGNKIHSNFGIYDYSSNFGGPSYYMNFAPGQIHYMIANPFNGNEMLREVDEKVIKSKFGGVSLEAINLEEDMSKPIKGGTKPATNATCFLISTTGIIVTNSHAIEKVKKITVRGIGGDFTKTYPVKVLVDDKSNDIALLQLDDPNVKFDSIPFNIRPSGVETGEEVFVLGYPLLKSMGEEIKLTTGVVSSKSGYQGTFSTYQVSASVQPGNSGSPLFDKNGNLIGIINAQLKDVKGVSYSIKIGYLNSILESSEIKNQLSNPVTTTAFSLTDLVKMYSKYIYIIETER